MDNVKNNAEGVDTPSALTETKIPNSELGFVASNSGHDVRLVKLKELYTHEKLGKQDITHSVQLKAYDRANEIYDMRKKGKTIREIAHYFEVSPSVISKIIRREVNRVTSKSREGLEEMRQIQLDRLDFMLNCLWPAMEKGVANAIEKGLAVMERQAKLMGLDAPEKKEISITYDMTSEEVIANAKQLGIEIPKELDYGNSVINADFVVKEPLPIENSNGEKT